MIGASMDTKEFYQWCRSEMVNKRRIRMVGHMGFGVPSSQVDASCFAHFHCAQIMHIGGRFVYFQVGYDRSASSLNAPTMKLLVLESNVFRTLLIDQVSPSIYVPMGWFSPSVHARKKPELINIAIEYGAHSAPVLDGDPWMLWHLGSMVQMVHDLDLSEVESTVQLRHLEGVRQMMAVSLENVAAARIARILSVQGRR